MQLRGCRAVDVALFQARLFDGAVDTPEDIHHVGPLGLGLFLLQQLVPVLRQIWPDTPAQGRARRAINDAGLLRLRRDEPVTWNAARQPAGAAAADQLWVRSTSTGQEGFVARGDIIKMRRADADLRDAVAALNAGLKQMCTAYVRGYKRFDFNLFAADAELCVLNRATTLELELLFTTFVLPVIVPASGDADWLVELFLTYNKLYFNWRRDCYFESDKLVMERQRRRFKELALAHLGDLSKTHLQTAKFEALDHVWPDIMRHAGEARRIPVELCLFLADVCATTQRHELSCFCLCASLCHSLLPGWPFQDPPSRVAARVTKHTRARPRSRSATARRHMSRTP